MMNGYNMHWWQQNWFFQEIFYYTDSHLSWLLFDVGCFVRRFEKAFQIEIARFVCHQNRFHKLFVYDQFETIHASFLHKAFGFALPFCTYFDGESSIAWAIPKNWKMFLSEQRIDFPMSIKVPAAVYLGGCSLHLFPVTIIVPHIKKSLTNHSYVFAA